MQNRIFFWLGTAHLCAFLALLIYYPFNDTIVLGLNSTVKPMKFALSIWIYSWTMGLILSYVEDIRKVTVYSWVAAVAMCFEQTAITSQALNGELSHFNRANVYGIIVFALMGVFILTATLWTAYITYIFIKQKRYQLPPYVSYAIKVGLIYFVAFSLFGGYISSLTGHTVGAADGGAGLLFLNWSTVFGDLRVAHFFGMHSLQIVPLFALSTTKLFDDATSLRVVRVFALVYLTFVLFVMAQGLMGLPFIAL